MSQEQARMFLDAAEQNREMKQAVQEYLLSGDTSKLVNFAWEWGYQFTKREIRQAIALNRESPPSFKPPMWQVQAGLAIAVAVFVVGVYFAVDFYKSYQRYSVLHNHGVTIEALVDDRWIVEATRYSQIKYYLHFRYTVEGRDYAFHQEVNSDTYDAFGFSPKMEIVYNPKNPAQAVLKGANTPEVWSLAAAIGFGLGAIFVTLKTLEIQRTPREISIKPLEE